MASTSTVQPRTALGESRTHETDFPRLSSDQNAALEMDRLSRPSQPLPPQTGEPSSLHAAPLPATSQEPQTLLSPEDIHTRSSAMDGAGPSVADTTTAMLQPARSRAESEAIGAATDNPSIRPDPSGGPVVMITLLLINGARHPYKVDDRYLRKRNVTVDDMNPFNISVYTLKELIWRDWREEWEPRPPSPSFIRLIHFGRLLDDKHPLKECRFNSESSNVVHMTVKPQDLVEEEDPKAAKSSGRDRDNGERTTGCRCVML